MTVTRLLVQDDARALCELLRRNRGFLAPWQPLRPKRYYMDEAQQEAVRRALHQHESGISVPLVILDQQAQIVGAMTL